MASDQYRSYIKHLASIVQPYEQAPKRGDGWAFDSDSHGVLARAESAIRKICDDNSPYTQRMQRILSKASYDDPIKAGLIVGIVRALKGDLEDGYLATFPELVRGEMFENLIEMAKHLLEGGYKDAAAVIAGTSLESHLRQLSIKRGLQLTSVAPDGTHKNRSAESLIRNFERTALMVCLIKDK